MMPAIQYGMHPDAESLTAFAEQLLSVGEREPIIAHLATCSRCREVVFLAQEAMEAELPGQVSIERGDSGRARRNWFGGWRWMWIPATALAGFIGFAVVLHVRRAGPEQQTARNDQQTETIQGGLPSETANAPAAPRTPRRDEPKTLSSIHQNGATLKSRGANEREGTASLDAKKATEKKDESKQTADEMIATSGALGGAAHGNFEARSKSSSIGGPMAQNQMQQNALAQAPAPDNAILNKPIAAAAPSLDASAEAVEVRPAQQAALSGARQMTTAPVAGQSVEVPRGGKRNAKSINLKLPSGLEALSVATAGGHTIAIDTSGELFLSEGADRQWQAVKTQWTGRAVLVKSLGAATDSVTQSIQQPPRFQLINDKLQTWTSVDGKIWTNQSLR